MLTRQQLRSHWICQTRIPIRIHRITQGLIAQGPIIQGLIAQEPIVPEQTVQEQITPVLAMEARRIRAQTVVLELLIRGQITEPVELEKAVLAEPLIRALILPVQIRIQQELTTSRPWHRPCQACLKQETKAKK